MCVCGVSRRRSLSHQGLDLVTKPTVSPNSPYRVLNKLALGEVDDGCPIIMPQGTQVGTINEEGNCDNSAPHKQTKSKWKKEIINT